LAVRQPQPEPPPAPARPNEQFELVDYPHTNVDRDHRNAAQASELSENPKRAKKRQWLDAQDEMRFSHSIQFNAVPDWSSHYIAYSNLKKL
jgi:phosphate transporter